MQTAVCVFSQRLRPRFIPSSQLQVRVRVIRCLFLRRFQLSRGHLMLMFYQDRLRPSINEA